MIEAMKQALKTAYRLGQEYWYQADHAFVSQNKKAEATRAKFDKLVEETCQAIEQAEKQEPKAWVERWYGSGQEQGWWIWERHSLTHGQSVARIGTGPFAERLTSIIVEKHNAALFLTESVKEPFASDPHNGTGPTPPAAPVQEPVECQYGNGGYACCEGGPCKADEQNNSAPDLLNALKRIVDEPNNTMSDGKALKEIIRIARRAITKATGEKT